MTKCLIHSLIFGRLIYCCLLLCNLPVNLMYKLELIQHQQCYICIMYTKLYLNSFFIWFNALVTLPINIAII